MGRYVHYAAVGLLATCCTHVLGIMHGYGIFCHVGVVHFFAMLVISICTFCKPYAHLCVFYILIVSVFYASKSLLAVLIVSQLEFAENDHVARNAGTLSWAV